MNFWKLILRNIQFRSRYHLGLSLSSCLSCGIITGALLVGDSVRYSLERICESRLGKVQWALNSRDRFLTTRLVDEIRKNVDGTVSSGILWNAVVGTPDGSARANQVQLLGVDNDFWELNNAKPSMVERSQDGAIINQRLCERLKVGVGDPLVVRVENPSRISRDTSFIPLEGDTKAFRFIVSGIVDSGEFGNFNLKNNQESPYNVFVPIRTLQKHLNREGRVNLLLLAGNKRELDFNSIEKTFQSHWTLEDLDLGLRSLSDSNCFELISERIFLDPQIVNTLKEKIPSCQRIFSYFVNELRINDRSTPYSVVTAIEPIAENERERFCSYSPPRTKESEIWLNTWCAEDLNASKGDRLTLNYFVADRRQSLNEQTASFKVAGIIPMDSAGFDSTLSVEFPGLNDSKNCRDWSVGIPIDLDRIRGKDEEYWDTYHSTPKAVLNYDAGKNLWKNRFGSVTGLRFDRHSNTKSSVEQMILGSIDPKSFGFRVEPVLEIAEKAINNSMDFGALFLGFSMFLIAAALTLTGLIFVFSLDQRSEELGIFGTLGFSHQWVRRLFWTEAMIICIPATAMGILLGIAYTKLILLALSTIWAGAVGDWNVFYKGSVSSMVIGSISCLILVSVLMALQLRNFGKKTLVSSLQSLKGQTTLSHRLRIKRDRAIGLVTLLGAICTVTWFMHQSKENEASGFFMAGAFVLISGIAFLSAYMSSLLPAEKSATKNRLRVLWKRNISRRHARSLSVIGMIACGSFLIISLESQKLHSKDDWRVRSSGTGGFALIGEATQPIYHDLATVSGQKEIGLIQEDKERLQIVPISTLHGDDASCLNLHRVETPRLLGVDPNEFIRRKAFSFKNVVKDQHLQNPWALLHQEFGANEIPGIIDHNTLTYGLGKKLGDTLVYHDEHGERLKIRLVGTLSNSILQGSIIVNQQALTKNFPSVSGSRFFLIDTPDATRFEVKKLLDERLGDFGIEWSTSSERLRNYHQVQNTYILVFQMLGALGLLLGSGGLGILLLRNVLERRAELAVMSVIGFRKKSIRRMLVSEHWFLVNLGLFCGALASAIALFPKGSKNFETIPWFSLGSLFILIAISGFVWTWIAASVALKSVPISALRNE